MGSINQNFTMFQGNDASLRFTIIDENDDALDLTGGIVHWSLALNNLKKPALIVKASDDVDPLVEITDAPGGVVTVTLIGDDTKTLSGGRYYHELELVDFEGNVSTLSTGHIILVPTLIKEPPEVFV